MISILSVDYQHMMHFRWRDVLSLSFRCRVCCCGTTMVTSWRWWAIVSSKKTSSDAALQHRIVIFIVIVIVIVIVRRHLKMQPTQSCNTQYNVWFRFHNYCLWASQCKAPHCIIPRWSSMHNSKKGFSSYKGHLQMQPSVHTRHKKHFSVFNWTILCKHTFSILKVTL